MGKRLKKAPKSKQKVPILEKARKVDSKGRIKRKRGDLKLVSSRKTGYDVKQKKGGKWVRTSDRKCKIHTVCNCVTRTDTHKMSKISNR